MLFSLPPEVLTFVFDDLVHCIGIHRSVHLRPMCRSFDEYILNAIYALPTFENVDDNYADHLTWDIQMSKSMVVRLIRTKLRNHQEDRALNREILHTASFITTSLVNAEKDVYTYTLVRLAADNLPLFEIIKGLSRDSSPADTAARLTENALAAALSLDQTSHIPALMKLGAKAQSRTKWFGDALHVAACYAAPKTFLSILGTVLATDDQFKERFAASRLIMALEHAATQGRADIFCSDLWTVIEETYDHCLVHQVFEPAIKGATLACHDNAVLAIFALLSSHNRSFLNASHDMYWAEVLRLAASNGSESTVQLILNNTAVVNAKGSLNLPLEDACRTGRTTIVQLLIAYSTGHNLDSYAGSMYWAAHNAHYDILNLVFRSLGRTGPSCLGDALCGASVNGTSGMSAVFDIIADRASVKKDLELDGKTFAQIIDMIFEAAAPSDSDIDTGLLALRKSSYESLDIIFRESLSEEHGQLARACREGVLSAVYHVVAQFGAEDTAARRYCGWGFSESISHQHPGILQFLCEKFPGNKFDTTGAASKVRSTAIFQILHDHGWTVDATSNRLMPPVLVSMRRSEELIRWFLNRGSDPNKRCDWDITPLSVAVATASLSTIRLMLRFGGDTRKGQLLHYAMDRTSLDQLAVIDMLISFGVPLDARKFGDEPGSWLGKNRALGMGTALHKAAELGNADATAYLLWRGANCGMLDSLGRTALDIAEEQHHHEIADMIEKITTSASQSQETVNAVRY